MDDRDPLCLDDIKMSPGSHHSHNGRDRDLLDRHLDSLSMSSASSACSALSWDGSPSSLSCRAVIELKKEPCEDLEEDDEHEVSKTSHLLGHNYSIKVVRHRFTFFRFFAKLNFRFFFYFFFLLFTFYD